MSERPESDVPELESVPDIPEAAEHTDEEKEQAWSSWRDIDEPTKHKIIASYRLAYIGERVADRRGLDLEGFVDVARFEGAHDLLGDAQLGEGGRHVDSCPRLGGQSGTTGEFECTGSAAPSPR